jgi:hypothetical protein
VSKLEESDRVLLVSNSEQIGIANTDDCRFSAFDEPWKIQYNSKGKEWEDKWGLMDVNRNLKQGLKIPDCGGVALPTFD